MKELENDRKMMEEAMREHLEKTKRFLKDAFCIDGEVTTTGKQCIVVEQDNSNYQGISFTLTDSQRGEFKIVMCNPSKMESPNDGVDDSKE